MTTKMGAEPWNRGQVGMTPMQGLVTLVPRCEQSTPQAQGVCPPAGPLTGLLGGSPH